ncbi:hypothetical protein KP509_03G072600 [Ceratopteris richardii]|nr:hypothetical protein KP509_03G072600 [Ceratopteris richardii]
MLALETELAILQSLHSPRILKCFGAEFSSGPGAPQYNLFLEYMEGGSIAELIKKTGGRMDETRARYYTRAIVEGLAYLHEKHIVHCDIKCQNILVGSCGVKIADFGAAKKKSANDSVHEIKGTPLWMAPEVLRGEQQGFESDIWSLGCTVVEMLQGVPPWGADFSRASTPATSHVAESLFKIAYSSENPTLPDNVSPECRDFLCKALDRDFKFRWTAAQLLEHPWIRGLENLNNCCALMSPRSTMDFPPSDSEEEDDQGSWWPSPHSSLSMVEEVALSSGSVTHAKAGSLLPLRAALRVCELGTCRRLDSGSSDTVYGFEDVQWITVRLASVEGIHGQKPSMRRPANAPLLLRRRAEEVNYASIEFLRKRMTRKSVQ